MFPRGVSVIFTLQEECSLHFTAHSGQKEDEFMVTATTLKYLVANFDGFKKAPGNAIVYYSDTDMVPVPVMQEIMTAGDRIRLVPAAELGDPKNILLAVLVRAAAEPDHTGYVVGELVSGKHDFSVDGTDYHIVVTPDFASAGQGQQAAAQQAAQPGAKQPPRQVKPAVQSSPAEGDSQADEATYPNFGEFVKGIPQATVPRSLSKHEFARALYDAIRHSACDSDTVQILESKIGAGASEAIEALNLCGALASLKDLVSP